MNFLSLFKRNLIYKFKKKISIDKDSFPKKDLDHLFFYYGSDKANYFQNKNLSYMAGTSRTDIAKNFKNEFSLDKVLSKYDALYQNFI